MQLKDKQVQNVLEETQQHLKSSLARLANMDAPFPALSLYTDTLSHFVQIQAVHKFVSEAETDEQKVKLIQKMVSELGLDCKSKSER
jgi:hypothetical protein